MAYSGVKLRIPTLSIFVALVLLLTIAMPVVALVFTSSILVSEGNGNTFAMVGVMCPMNNDYLASAGYIDSDGLDVGIAQGATYKPRMLTDNMTLFAVPVPAHSSTSYTYTTDQTPSNFDIIPGYGGYFTVADDADLEMSDSGVVTLTDAYIDTDNGTGKYLFDHYDASNGGVRCFVSENVSENVTARIVTYGVGGGPAVIATRNGGNNAVNNTDHTVNMPAGVESGDLLIALFSADGNSAITFPGGWTQLYQQANGVSVISGVWYRVSDGGEGATITVTTGAAEMSGHTTFRITGYYGTPEVGVVATGTSVNPNPPNLAPSWGAENSLWIAVCGYDVGNSGSLISAYPAGYTDGRDDRPSAIEGGASGSANLTNNNAAENPGTFTITFAEEWVANTIAIAPSQSIDIDVSATGVASGEHDVKVSVEPSLTFVAANTDNVTIPDNDAFTFNTAGQDQPFSILAWVNYTDATSGTIISKGATTGDKREWDFLTGGADTLVCNIWNTVGTAYIRIVSDDALTPYEGEWIQVAYTYDGSETTGGVALYINGEVIDATITTFGTYTGMSNSTADVKIGCRDEGDYFLDGEISEVIVYDVELTPAQVLANYNGTVKETDLLAWYKLDEGAGNPQDSSGNGYHATGNTADWDVGLFALVVDDSLYFTDAVSVPDSSANWTFMDNAAADFMPYCDKVEIEVDDVLQAWYEPNDMISGTTLPDREATGGDNDGTFTWGNNPAGVAVLASSIEMVGEGAAGVGIITPDSADIMTAPDNMTLTDSEMGMHNNEFYVLVKWLSDITGIEVVMLWWWLSAVLALGALAVTRRYTNNVWIAGFMCAMIAGAFVAMGYTSGDAGALEFWVPGVVVIATIFAGVWQRAQGV